MKLSKLNFSSFPRIFQRKNFFQKPTHYSANTQSLKCTIHFRSLCNFQIATKSESFASAVIPSRTQLIALLSTPQKQQQSRNPWSVPWNCPPGIVPSSLPVSDWSAERSSLNKRNTKRRAVSNWVTELVLCNNKNFDQKKGRKWPPPGRCWENPEVVTNGMRKTTRVPGWVCFGKEGQKKNKD